MAEPARKLDDEIDQPYLRSIPNGKSAKIIDLSAARRARELDGLEKNTETPNTEESVSSQEENSSTLNTNSDSFINNVQGKTEESQKTSFKVTAQNFIKKRGPLTTIILTLVGGGIGIGGLLSPGLLLVQIKETMVNKFNVQLTSMDIRTKKITISKMSGGLCNSAIKIGCKFSSMTDTQIDRFKKAGIDIEVEGTKNLVGRNKVKSITYNGADIKAENLSNLLDTDPSFRLAVKKAYNPLFAGFYDGVWNKTLFYIDKKGVKLGGKEATDAERLAEIQKTTKKAVDIKKTGAPDPTDLDEGLNEDQKASKYTDANGNAIPEDDITKVKNSAATLAEEVTSNADEIAESGTKSATKMAGEVVEILGETATDVAAAASKAKSALTLTGWIDNACTAYGTVRAIGFAAKTVRVVQYVAYAALFLKVADMIKAGVNPDPGDVEYLGNVLTTPAVSSTIVNGLKQTTSKTATDSFGYKYAAYGEVGTMPETASQFLAGAGLTGALTGLTSELNYVLGGAPETTCRVTQNILFQIGSAAVSLAVGIATGGVSITAGALIQGTASVLLMVGVAMLPSLLQDIVAGVVVDNTTIGDLAGDAITSGSSNMMGSLAKTGGNAPLSVEQAIAYSNLSKQVAAEYAEEDRIAYSPLDATNPNTFMGSLVSKILPYLSNVSSIPSAINSLSSFAGSSVALINSTSAYASNTGEEYNLCQDYDYKNMGIAADPYCNIAYGIPNEDLNIEPSTVIEKISGELDEDGNAKIGSDFYNFQNECIYNTEPIGYSGADFQAEYGTSCMLPSSKYPNAKYYYLYTIDSRIDAGMSGEDEDLNVALEKGLDSKIAFYDGADINDNTTASQSFFGKIQEFFSNLFSNKKSDLSYNNNQLLSRVVTI